VPEPPQTVSSPTPPPETKPERSPCLLGSGDPVRFESLRIVLVDPVLPGHAPLATNDSEALVFRQLYETLVQVDCDGRVSPGLARSWQSTENGRVWVFTLRDSAFFSDGTPVSAADVRDAWALARSFPFVPGRPAPWSWIRQDAVQVSGPRQLIVRMTATPPNQAAFFAHTQLAVWKRSPEWARGSGPFRVSAGSVSWGFDLEPNPAHPFVDRGRSALEFSVHPGSDPRDVLGKADLLLLETRGALSYARSLGEFQTFPLAWSRTYVLVSPQYSGDRTQSKSWSELRGELAEHIVDADARPVSGFSGSAIRDCTLPRNIAWAHVPPPDAIALDPDGGHQLVYLEDDPDAKKLAERLVALAGDTTGTVHRKVLLGSMEAPSAEADPVAVRLGPSVFASSLLVGDRWAYLVSLEGTFSDPCLDAAAFAGSVRWLTARVNTARPRSGSALSMAGIPLLTERNHAALRRGVAGVAQDWDGVLRLQGAGWTGAEAP
jgi:extracellular solute-binding protein (family 5)